jgi:hypothetical protein
MNSTRKFVWALAIACLIGFAASMEALACPFCEEKGFTLLGQFEEAEFVLIGHFKNGRGGLDDMGTSEFVIDRVIKSHDAVKGKTEITVSKRVPDARTKYIVFCDLYKGKIDPYKGMPVTNAGEMIRYIDGMLALKGKPQPERLRYAFDFLNSPEVEVAMDAYREFAKADYTEYKDMAKKLPADTIAGWLKDKRTPPFRYGLYASLLGHCGTSEHAKMLREMIDDPEKRKGSGLYGFMASYVMLEPQKGWAMLTDTVQKREKPFLVRYAALQTIRFLWEYRTDLINKDESAAKSEIVKGVAGVLQVSDMADFAIEDLRKWQRWEYTDQVIGMFGQKGFNTPGIRKSIVRFALQSKEPRAAEFIKVQRARDAEWVDETRELLELESFATPAVPAKSK